MEMSRWMTSSSPTPLVRQDPQCNAHEVMRRFMRCILNFDCIFTTLQPRYCLHAGSSSRDKFPPQSAQAANGVKGLGMCQRLSLNGKIAGSADSGSLVRAGRYRFFIPLSESTPSSRPLPPLTLTQLSYPPTSYMYSSFPLLLLPICMTQPLAASLYLA